eukprot:scaffold1690_cov118-Isochrysis_galbana.AAC.3
MGVPETAHRRSDVRAQAARATFVVRPLMTCASSSTTRRQRVANRGGGVLRAAEAEVSAPAYGALGLAPPLAEASSSASMASCTECSEASVPIPWWRARRPRAAESARPTATATTSGRPPACSRAGCAPARGSGWHAAGTRAWAPVAPRRGTPAHVANLLPLALQRTSSQRRPAALVEPSPTTQPGRWRPRSHRLIYALCSSPHGRRAPWPCSSEAVRAAVVASAGAPSRHRSPRPSRHRTRRRPAETSSPARRPAG